MNNPQTVEEIVNKICSCRKKKGGGMGDEARAKRLVNQMESSNPRVEIEILY